MTASVDLFGRPERQRRQSRQLPLPLGWRVGGSEPPVLLIGDSNEALIAALTDWQSWSAKVAVLIGPPRSGKSLLAAYVAEQTGLVAVIDPAMTVDETSLFHLCTAAEADRTPLLIVAEPYWRPHLPDLATRVAAAQDFFVPDPDLKLVAALLCQRLAEHHLVLPLDVATYLARRIDRSFSAIDMATDVLAAAALDVGRPFSMPFVRQILQDAGSASLTTGADPAAA